MFLFEFVAVLTQHVDVMGGDLLSAVGSPKISESYSVSVWIGLCVLQVAPATDTTPRVLGDGLELCVPGEAGRHLASKVTNPLLRTPELCRFLCLSSESAHVREDLVEPSQRRTCISQLLKHEHSRMTRHQAASRLLQHPADEAGCQKADEQHHARHHRIGLCHTLGLQVAQRIVWAPLGRGSADPDPCGAHRSKGLKSFARLDLAGQGDGVVEAFVAHEVHVDRVLEKLVPVKGNHAFGFAWETHLQAKTLKEEPVDEHDSA